MPVGPNQSNFVFNTPSNRAPWISDATTDATSGFVISGHSGLLGANQTKTLQIQYKDASEAVARDLTIYNNSGQDCSITLAICKTARMDVQQVEVCPTVLNIPAGASRTLYDLAVTQITEKNLSGTTAQTNYGVQYIAILMPRQA